MLFLTALAVIAGAFLTYSCGGVEYVAGDRGIVFPSANLWIASHQVEMWVNVAATIGVAAMMTALNRSYNLLKAMTLLDSSFFLAMSLTTPWLLMQFYTGTPLSVVLVLCLFLLYSTFGGNPWAPQRIFLIFFILSGMTMTQYCYAVYIPVFIVGCWQMRIANGRTIVAMLLGLVTPWWIVLGSGLVNPASVHVPRFADLFSSFDIGASIRIYVAVFFSALMLIGGWVLNFPQMIAYNAHMRAFNGTLSLLSLVTLLAVVADFINVSVYAPVLYMCAAFYLGRFFALHKRPRSFIAILIILFVCVLIFAWNVAVAK